MDKIMNEFDYLELLELLAFHQTNFKSLKSKVEKISESEIKIINNENLLSIQNTINFMKDNLRGVILEPSMLNREYSLLEYLIEYLSENDNLDNPNLSDILGEWRLFISPFDKHCNFVFDSNYLQYHSKKLKIFFIDFAKYFFDKTGETRFKNLYMSLRPLIKNK